MISDFFVFLLASLSLCTLKNYLCGFGKFIIIKHLYCVAKSTIVSNCHLQSTSLYRAMSSVNQTYSTQHQKEISQILTILSGKFLYHMLFLYKLTILFQQYHYAV